ncbi:WXG100-like domain-containing protein [Streptomyces sp. NPDC002644]
MLPDELVKVLDIIGVAWPDIDEDEIRSSADDYRALATGLRDAVKDGNTAHSHLVGGRSKGKAVSAIDARWTKLAGKDLGPFADALDTLAGALDECAGLIEGCKYVCIAELTATAATATAGIVGAVFTLGASAALSAAAVAACRLAVKEAISYAIGMITDIVTEKIEAKVLAELERILVEQVGPQAQDGMRLNGTDPEPAADGGPDDELSLVEEEFDLAAGDLEKARDDFDGKKKNHRTGGGKRRGSVKKDSRFHKLATVIDKCEDLVDKKIDDVFDAVEKHGKDIKRAKKDQKDRDLDTKEEIDRLRTPEQRMYLLNADGSVVELYDNGTTSKPISKSEPLVGQILQDDGTYWRPTGRRNRNFTLPRSHKDKVRSRKLPPGKYNPLAHATQLARYARKDYNGGNYAAAQYVDDKGNRVILVGDSGSGPHSERVLGYPILHNDRQRQVQAVYTEREPCQKSPRCEGWLDKFFENDPKVMHHARYDQEHTPSGGKVDDSQHRTYRRELEKWHAKHGSGGGSIPMMSSW